MLKYTSLGDWIALSFAASAVVLSQGCGPITLDDELDDARAAWGVLSMCPVQLYQASPASTADRCGNPPIPPGFPPDAHVEGCSKISACTIYISEDVVDPDRRRHVLEHELGHILKGTPGHLKCADVPGDDIMCPDGGGPWVDAPTARDLAFVKAR